MIVAGPWAVSELCQNRLPVPAPFTLFAAATPLETVEIPPVFCRFAPKCASGPRPW
jgi:hypothetical protein